MVERGVPLNIGFKGAEANTASDTRQKVFICDDKGEANEYEYECRPARALDGRTTAAP